MNYGCVVRQMEQNITGAIIATLHKLGSRFYVLIHKL